MSKEAKGENETAHPPGKLDWKAISPYVETLAIVVAIAFIQHTANLFMEERSRYTLMLIGTCYGTWRGGKGPGIFALLLSGLIGAYFLAPQRFSLVIQDILDSVNLTLYLIVGAVIIVFGESQRQERKRVQEREQQLIAAHEELAKANATLEHLLEIRQEELTEIKRFVADEDLPPSVPHHRHAPHHETHSDEPLPSDEEI